jgi:hypothetical protein
VNARYERDRAVVARHLPPGTLHTRLQGRDVWTFRKQTEVGIPFELAVYYEPDESPSGYCVRLITPQIEAAWKNPHVGHIYADGTICFGGSSPSWRCRHTLLDAYAKACLWADGMAIMLAAKHAGRPCEFPFSNNNSAADVAP